MMIEAISDAIEKAKSSTTDGRGLICQFYKVGNVGAKVYKDRYQAQENLNSQQLLHKLGFAPKVLSELITFDDYGDIMYMFLTELAITIKTIANSEGLHDRDKHLYSYRCNFETSYRFRHFAKLFQDIFDAGYCDSDQHQGNYGYLPSGKPVVIDCEFVCYNSLYISE